MPPKVNAAPPRFDTESTSFSPSGQNSRASEANGSLPTKYGTERKSSACGTASRSSHHRLQREDVEGAVVRDDLDPNGNATLAVDVPTLLPVTHARAFVPAGMNRGLPSLSGGVRAGNVCGGVVASAGVAAVAAGFCGFISRTLPVKLVEPPPA